MDLEMVLNELSLRIPADNVQTAQHRMSDLVDTAREAAEFGVKPIIRTHSDFYNTVLAHNYSLSNWLVDKNVNRDEIRFILTAAKTPFLADIQNSEIEDKTILSDFSCEGEISEGLKIAYLLESLALSIKSDPQWDSHTIVLEATWLENDDTYDSDTLTVFHASNKEHIQRHIPWIQERLKTGVLDGVDLWNRREELFPTLLFCESVSPQIRSLEKTNPILRQVVNRLFALDKSCRSWVNGSYDLNQLSKASPESESRLRQFQQELTFKCPDGDKRIFSLHVRMTPGDWRLHFSTELGPGKIIIGYVGRKIQ
ncbi:MAG: hypothetical protein KME28_05000 [Pelatocladus maniniholoensis HA4357-MV3]|jgi:hypothetical protein|uniref:Uncharacterized protein n=1 Tax=Pelatocladus maniniholoensis HA4357-MV3 TaxID=1117104 RepID=A0A9E3H569_9NOST|nr:hypothetical protein [Pelatocladus maniniholoensis HA4357-MV3]BAZ65466.1 hypothetical protein NIES4106_02050 [Fischerella sp. NIES-4106]